MLIPRSFGLGAFSIHIYGLIIALAILLGWLLAKKRAHLYKIPASFFDSFWLLLPLALGIVGGRLYHVIDKWGIYSQNPVLIFNLANGGMGIFGALVGILVGFIVVAKIHHLPFLKLLDLAAPSILIGQALGRIGNYINQEGFGPPTNQPWGVNIEKQNRPEQFLLSEKFHPTFFYEAILELIFFFILLKLATKYKKPGQSFGLYLIFYSISRFTAEIFRIDTATVGPIKVAYIVSLALIILGFFLIFKPKSGVDTT